MSVGHETEASVKLFINQLAKNSKKLQNPNALLQHVKQQLKLQKKLETQQAAEGELNYGG